MKKIKAKIKNGDELNDLFNELIDEDGYIEGYLVGKNYLLGEIIESSDEYIVPSFWVIIDEKTIIEGVV